MQGMPWDLEKFAYFSKAALSILPTIGFRPDLIHCHDWQTGSSFRFTCTSVSRQMNSIGESKQS